MSNDKIDNIKFPIVGFLTEFNNKEIENIYNKLLKRDNIKKEHSSYKIK